MNSRITLESMKRKRRKRSMIPFGPVTLVGITLLIIGAAWAFGLMISSRFKISIKHQAVHDHMSHERRAKDRNKLLEKILGGFPQRASIWPEDGQQGKFYESLRKCVPEKFESDKKCKERIRSGESKKSVGILRTPSVLGRALETFTLEHMKAQNVNTTDVVLITTSHIDSRERRFTKIIRITVLPLLLEAVDLALQTVDDTFLAQQITLDDILGVVRLLIRWHCRLSDIATDTALENLSLDPTVSFPNKGETKLNNFFGFSIEKSGTKEKRAETDPLAMETMLRVDQCTEFVLELQARNRKSAEDIDVMIDSVVKQEFAHETCQSTMNLLDRRVTEIVGHFLAVSEHTALIICHKYPHVPMCEAEYQSQRM